MIDIKYIETQSVFISIMSRMFGYKRITNMREFVFYTEYTTKNNFIELAYTKPCFAKDSNVSIYFKYKNNWKSKVFDKLIRLCNIDVSNDPPELIDDTAYMTRMINDVLREEEYVSERKKRLTNYEYIEGECGSAVSD